MSRAVDKNGRHIRHGQPKLSKSGNPVKFKDSTCRGCGKTFQPNSTRHWTCPECSETSSLKTRVYRYGAAGLVIKALMGERDGLCVLCDRPGTDIDHDHATGKVRGWLCPGCNMSLNRLELEGWLELALEYVKRGKLKCSSQQLQLSL